MALVTIIKTPPRNDLGGMLRAVRSEPQGGSGIKAKADDTTCF